MSGGTGDGALSLTDCHCQRMERPDLNRRKAAPVGFGRLGNENLSQPPRLLLESSRLQRFKVQKVQI